MAGSDKQDVITYMSFFFVDIVGLSDPSMSTTTQINKIKVLNRIISECKTFSSTQKSDIIVLPTGDGMAIGFLKGLEKPLLLAREFQQKLGEYNYSRSAIEKIAVRIGCNDGHVFVVKDIYGNLNVWGPGIILARRVMDLGDAGHILMLSSMAESLMELSKEYRQMIHLAGDFEIKHDQKILLYSAYGQGFGNPANPVKGRRTVDGERATELPKSTEGVVYKKIELNYALKDAGSNLVKHSKKCYVKNNAKEPVFVLNETLADTRGSLSSVNLSILDEGNEQLPISGVISDGSRKVFVVKFREPILSGEDNKVYSLSYEVAEDEKCLSETMANGCHELRVTFEYPIDTLVEPRLTYVRNGEAHPIERDILVKSSGRYIMRWKNLHGIFRGDAVRLEW